MSVPGIKFSDLESLDTHSIDLSAIIPVVQDNKNCVIPVGELTYDDSTLQSASGTWDAAYTAVAAGSAQWAVDTDTIYDDSLIQASSGNWDTAYTLVGANSAQWAEQTSITELQSTSATWDTAYTAVTTSSAQWATDTDTIYDDSLLQSTSGSWNTAYTAVNSSSAQWATDTDTIYDDSLIQSTSGNWDTAYTAVTTSSADWATDTDTIYDDSLIQSTSGSWNTAYTAVTTSSAQWATDTDTIYDDSLIQSTSGNWDTAYTAVNSSSADWDSTYTTVVNESASWVGGGGGSGGTVQNANLSIEAADEGTVAGNARGANAVDLQTTRTVATEVASGLYSVIGGGYKNTAENQSSTVAGGQVNRAADFASFVGGGALNTASSYVSTIVAGQNNTTSGYYSFIGAGRDNTISGYYSAILGGHNNSDGGFTKAMIIGTGITATDVNTLHCNNLKIEDGGFKMPTGATNNYVLTTDASGVGTWQAASGGGSGGQVDSVVAGTNITIDNTDPVNPIISASGGGGGSGGTVQNANLSIEAADEGTVAGNARGANAVDLQTTRTVATQVASGTRSNILGGRENTASGNYSTVIGGWGNSATEQYATVLNGRANTASGEYAVVGGDNNTVSGYYSVAVGGGYNTVSGYYSFIGSGYGNTTSGYISTLGGGYNNTIAVTGTQSTLGGGYNNTITGEYAVIGGGSDNTNGGGNSTIGGGNNNTTTGSYSTVIGGRNNNAAGVYSIAAGHNANTGANAGTFAFADSTTNPGTVIPNAADQFAIKAAGGLRLIDGNEGANKVLTSDANGVGTWQAAGGGGGGTVQGTDGTYDIQATNEGTVAGNVRGENSVDLQTSRSLATQVASGDYSVIGGGKNNTASGSHGGNTISGGELNTASGYFCIVGGGFTNTASDYFSFVGGGLVNTASSTYSTVGGGNTNTASGLGSTVCGGEFNVASGRYSVAAGRYAQTGANDGTFAFADSATTVGTVIPNAANQFAIKAAGGLRLIDGNEGANKVLTCDADGVGTWQEAGSTTAIQSLSTLGSHTAPNPLVIDLTQGLNVEGILTANVALQLSGADAGQSGLITLGNGNTHDGVGFIVDFHINNTTNQTHAAGGHSVMSGDLSDFATTPSVGEYNYGTIGWYYTGMEYMLYVSDVKPYTDSIQV